MNVGRVARWLRALVGLKPTSNEWRRTRMMIAFFPMDGMHEEKTAKVLQLVLALFNLRRYFDIDVSGYDHGYEVHCTCYISESEIEAIEKFFKMVFCHNGLDGSVGVCYVEA
jgi:hypothetical protein